MYTGAATYRFAIGNQRKKYVNLLYFQSAKPYRKLINRVLLICSPFTWGPQASMFINKEIRRNDRLSAAQ